MPFAKKFRAMMGFPFAGDMVGGFTVESVDVTDQPLGAGRYNYAVHMVLHGPGGQQGLRQALKALFSSHPMTFSGYGNPYQLWFAKPEIESLGDRRYAVRVEGAGARVHLADELRRFLDYLDQGERLIHTSDPTELEALLETYLQQYQAEVRLKVNRYRSKLRRMSSRLPDLDDSAVAEEPAAAQQPESAMPQEIFPSSYRCPCGHELHFFENTVREAKAMSLKRVIRLGDSATDRHQVIFYRGKMVDIACPVRDANNSSKG